MTRNSTEVWNEIKNSPLNTGITTGEVRLNYWDGRDVFEGEYVSADYVTVDAADISETQIHFKENGHYGSSHLILGCKYLLDTEKAYANSGSVGYGQLHDTSTVLALTPTVDIIHTTSNGSNETVGTSTTDFASLTHQATITDNAGTVAWNTERHAFTLRTTITITRNTAGGTVTGIDALMVTLMMSEIHRSDK